MKFIFYAPLIQTDFFDGIKKIKTLTDTAQRQKTMLLNLNILKGFEMRLNEAVNYLSDK